MQDYIKNGWKLIGKRSTIKHYVTKYILSFK